MLIGLGHKRGVGKTTIAKMFSEQFGFTRLAFAEPLRQAAKALYDFSPEQLYGKAKDIVDPYWGLSPRGVLHLLGKSLSPDQLVLLIRKKLEFGGLRGRPYWDVVIEDVRLPQETELVKDYGGYLIKVESSIKPGSIQEEFWTETALDNFEWDGRIKNIGSSKNLADQVCSLIHNLRIGNIPIYV